MQIRRAENKDAEKILDLLRQVLNIHAAIRPDVFIPDTTKYTESELYDMFKDDTRPVFVAVSDDDKVLGYAFCVLKKQPFSNNMVPFTSLFIDDLCVDESCRGMHIGQKLFDFVKDQAKALGCYEITLNVWEGNDAAMGFYKNLGLKPKETQMEYIL